MSEAAAVVTAWDVSGTQPGTTPPVIPYPWFRPTCALGDCTEPAFGLVLFSPHFDLDVRWTAACAEGVANYRRGNKGVAIPAMTETIDVPQRAGASDTEEREVVPGTEPGMVLVYEHPQGSTIKVYPDGTMDARKPDGKKKTTSATPEKLAAGHGQWALTAKEPVA